MNERLSQILAAHQRQKGAAIAILQKTQEELGYLSEETLSEIANFLGQSKNELFGIASFYAQFRFNRQGEHTVKVCQGTACYVQGGRRILEKVEEELGINSGGTSADHKFSLERVACFGSCALAPVMVVDKTVYGRLTEDKTKQIIGEYRKK